MSPEHITIVTTIATIVTAIAALITPIAVVFLGSRIQRAQKREEALLLQEEVLRGDRVVIYDTILEPYIILLTNKEAFEKDKRYRGKTRDEIAQEKQLSLAYRQASFKLALLGSDDVVKAYNSLMQYIYTHQSSADTKKLMQLLGDFLLEIRKGVGNENTSLSNLQMLEWMIKDMDQITD